MKNPTAEVLAEVAGERFKQDEKWGVQNHSPDRWHSILLEELGEACKESLEAYPLTTSGITREIMKDRLKNWRNEMVQVAAVAVAAIECHDRNEDNI